MIPQKPTSKYRICWRLNFSEGNMKKLKIYSSQFNYQYGNSIHFPYSIASLFAYIKSFPELDKQLQFEKTLIAPIQHILDVVGWNWEYKPPINTLAEFFN